jgi:hypothetical protein
MDRPVFIDHGGKRILRVDYSGIGARDLPGALSAAMQVVAKEPRSSIRILTIVNEHFDAFAADAIKRYSAHNAPYLRASAIVGASPFRKVLMEGLKLQGRRELEAFDTEAEALAWLAAR